MEYCKEIIAIYDKQHICVYQAYNREIAQEAVALQTFGGHFNPNRMTWIKPSFLWMMYRSNWGMKKDQEYILALTIYQEKFIELLQKAVMTSPGPSMYGDSQLWRSALKESEVYCQWDPDKNVSGNPMNRAAIQIGLKGDTLQDFISNGIVKIEDFTPKVIKWRDQRRQGKLDEKDLPSEKIFEISDKKIRKRLGMKIN